MGDAVETDREWVRAVSALRWWCAPGVASRRALGSLAGAGSD